MPDFRQLLIDLVAGFSNETNASDVAGDAFKVLRLAGIEVPEDVSDLDELSRYLLAEENAVSLWYGR